jgi:hypothetical protein
MPGSPVDGAFAAWYDAYCAATDRHTGREAARAWYDNRVPVAEAALWARFGFTCEAALPHIDAGRTPGSVRG